MKVNMYSCYDKKAEQYSFPQNFANHATAIRWFENVVPECEMIKNDLELVYIGQYDTDNGIFENASFDKNVEAHRTVLMCGYDIQDKKSIEEVNLNEAN